MRDMSDLYYIVVGTIFLVPAFFELKNSHYEQKVYLIAF